MCNIIYLNYRNIERLILLQCIRPDKLIFEIRRFIGENLGEEFVSAPAFDLSTSFGDSDRYKPLILILAPGSDPLSAIKAFVPEDPKDRPVATTFVSLGQGQGQAAIPSYGEAIHNAPCVQRQRCDAWRFV